MRKKFIAALILILFSIPCVLAQVEYIGKTGENLQLFASCFVDGAYVPSEMNITVYYPNTSILLEDAVMQNFSAGSFNYSLTLPQVTGNYDIHFMCLRLSDGSIAKTSGTLIVTGDHEKMFSVVFGLVAILAFLVFVAYQKKEDGLKDGLKIAKNTIIKYVVLLGILLLTAILKYYTDNTPINLLMSSIFYVTLIIVTSIGMIGFIIFVIRFLNEVFNSAK